VTAEQLRAENWINEFEPQLVDPENGDYRPIAGGNVMQALAVAIPDFHWTDVPASPVVPQGDLSNTVANDRNGRLADGCGQCARRVQCGEDATLSFYGDFNGDGTTDVLWQKPDDRIARRVAHHERRDDRLGRHGRGRSE